MAEVRGAHWQGAGGRCSAFPPKGRSWGGIGRFRGSRGSVWGDRMHTVSSVSIRSLEKTELLEKCRGVFQVVGAGVHMESMGPHPPRWQQNGNSYSWLRVVLEQGWPPPSIIDSMRINEHFIVSIKLYLQKQAGGQVGS